LDPTPIELQIVEAEAELFVWGVFDRRPTVTPLFSRKLFECNALQRLRQGSKLDAPSQSRRERKKIEMRFAHLKRILKLGRLRLRGPRGAQDEFVLAAIAQNLRRLAAPVARPPPARAWCTA